MYKFTFRPIDPPHLREKYLQGIKTTAVRRKQPWAQHCKNKTSFQDEEESNPKASHSSLASWPLSMARCLSKNTGHSSEPHESAPKISGGGWPVHWRHTSNSCCDARSDSRSREKAATLAAGSLFHVFYFRGIGGSGERGKRGGEYLAERSRRRHA